MLSTVFCVKNKLTGLVAGYIEITKRQYLHHIATPSNHSTATTTTAIKVTTATTNFTATTAATITATRAKGIKATFWGTLTLY